MASCCDKKACDLEKVPKGQAKVLWIVLAINLVMFVVELTAGWLSDSLALTGDSLDMLGDSIAYGASLYVINMGQSAKARSAALKGVIILVSAVAILGTAIYRTMNPEIPQFSIMTVVGLAALAANAVCLVLLTRHKNDDINMSSVWLCSRNDIISNTAVLTAAGLVWYLASPWPDLIVGIALTALFVKSAVSILQGSRRELLLQKTKPA